MRASGRYIFLLFLNSKTDSRSSRISIVILASKIWFPPHMAKLSKIATSSKRTLKILSISSDYPPSPKTNLTWTWSIFPISSKNSKLGIVMLPRRIWRKTPRSKRNTTWQRRESWLTGPESFWDWTSPRRSALLPISTKRVWTKSSRTWTDNTRNRGRLTATVLKSNLVPFANFKGQKEMFQWGPTTPEEINRPRRPWKAQWTSSWDEISKRGPHRTGERSVVRIHKICHCS